VSTVEHINGVKLSSGDAHVRSKNSPTNRDQNGSPQDRLGGRDKAKL